MLLSVLKDLLPSFSRSRRQVAASAASAPLSIADLRYQRGGAILAFVAPSEGDALKQHTLEMLEPLRASCADVIVVDFKDPEWARQLEATADNPIWFVMSPFGVGEHLGLGDDEGTNPWTLAGIPFVRLYGDTPAYFPAKHLQHFPNTINAYGHPEHQDFFVRWCAPMGNSVTLPLFPFDTIAKESVDFDRKASGGAIIFPKNGNSPVQLIDYWRSRLPPYLAKALEAVAEDCGSALDEPTDLMAKVYDHFATLSIDLSGSQRLLFFLIAQLDDYLRRRKSTLIARTLLDYPVTIRGVHWEHIDFTGKRARHDPDSDYTRTRRLLDESLAVVDMSPNTHRGAHDRVLRAAGRYTAVLTNRQQFYVDNFPDHDAFTFRFRADSIGERIEAALSQPRATVEMGVAQAERMRQLLTKEHYVAQLIAAVDACAFACGERPAGTQNFVDYQPLPR